MEISDQKAGWVQLLKETLLADLQLMWPHRIDTTWLATDNELQLIPCDSTDSVRLIVEYPKTVWSIEVMPSQLAKVDEAPVRFTFINPHDAHQAARAFQAYYATVVRPHMENM